MVVGGGACALAAVHTLRERGYEGRLVVIGEEGRVPYERPPLSKAYLAGSLGEEALAPLDAAWYRDHSVELVTARATELDPSRHVVVAAGEVHRYSRLLVATGGTPRRLPGDEEGTRYLRTLDDARALRKAIRPGERLVVAGGGFLGCEVAATARALGAEVTLAEVAGRLMSPLPPVVSEAMARLHSSHGVELLLGMGIQSAEPVGEGVRATTGDGRVIEAGALVAALGIVPNDALAAGAGIATGDGVLVDEACRTNAGDVFAAGDVARHRHPLHPAPVRVEHHDHALKHGDAAARAMLGEEVVYDAPHWFWSDQFGHNLQHAGRSDGAEDEVIRGSLRDLDFTILYLRDGSVRGVVTMNRPTEMRAALRLMAKAERVDAVELGSPSTDLRALARGRGGRRGEPSTP